MREIKFRAWDISHSREMSPVFGLNCVELWEWCEKNGLEWELDGKIMQYTGLKDKNGVEIYEYDVVENFAFRDVVIFDKGVFTTKNSKANKFGTKQPLAVHSEIEVIGNIYEDKHLLK